MDGYLTVLPLLFDKSRSDLLFWSSEFLMHYFSRFVPSARSDECRGAKPWFGVWGSRVDSREEWGKKRISLDLQLLPLMISSKSVVNKKTRVLPYFFPFLHYFTNFSIFWFSRVHCDGYEKFEFFLYKMKKILKITKDELQD